MLIILSGTSSSGKTSLALALQELASRPLLHLEADRFAPTLPADHPARRTPEFHTRAALVMHEAIAAYGRAGLDVIVDGSLPTEPELRDRCLAILRVVPDTRVVAVRCSVEVLRRREASRADRPAGWAEEQAGIMYEGLKFDAAVDTTSRTPHDVAGELLRTLFPA
ncbi:MAG: AAA family ATPase [Dehalococcoidia bacterium]